jgi:gas vesicle protein
MATGSLLTALIGFFGVVIGAVISASVTIYVTNKQQKAANKRLRSEYYMEKKVESMAELHAELEECFQTIEDFLEEMSRSMSVSEYEENVEPKVESFHKALMRHSIYLTEEQEQALFSMLTQFRMISADIEDFLTAGEEDRDKEPRTHQGNLREAWEKAKEELKDEMNVPPHNHQSDVSDK